MDWVSEMRAGMKMMAKACEKNTDWTKCHECPFDEICTMLMDKGVKDGFEYDTFTPLNWVEGKK